MGAPRAHVKLWVVGAVDREAVLLGTGDGVDRWLVWSVCWGVPIMGADAMVGLGG